MSQEVSNRLCLIHGLLRTLRRRIFRPTGIFRVDPLFLLQDQVREPRNYLSILHAIGGGKHTLDEISKASGLAKQNASTYLGRLADLYFVERRAPVTLPPRRRGPSRQGRWHLRDPYLRFYFRFVSPTSLRTIVTATASRQQAKKKDSNILSVPPPPIISFQRPTQRRPSSVAALCNKEMLLPPC